LTSQIAYKRHIHKYKSHFCSHKTTVAYSKEL